MSSSQGSNSTEILEFGKTHVIKSQGKHEATIVWLHGLDDTGLSASSFLKTLPLPNIKWICPTAPTRPLSVLQGRPCTAWFDMLQDLSEDGPDDILDMLQDLSEDGPDDIQGLDASAAHVASILSQQPPHIKLGIGGFGIGATTALYSATCHVLGQYGSSYTYELNLSSVIGLSGWLPRSRILKSLIERSNRLKPSHAAASRASSLPILLCHGSEDLYVPYEHGEQSASVLTTAGFNNLTFKSYDGLHHGTNSEEMDDVCHWLGTTLELQGW